MINKRNSTLLYWLILLFGTATLVALSFRDRIWADEAYTCAMVQHSFSEIWRITAADAHPPLYYHLAKLFSMPFGYSQCALRLFSGISCLLLIAIGGDQISRLFDRKTGLAFMILYLLFPFALEYSNEIRMYALSALEVFLCALFAYRIWQKNSLWYWIGLTVFGVCGGYTHYFALGSVCVIYGLLFLCCLFRKRELLKYWLASVVICIALYLPWLKEFLGQLAYKADNAYWIPPITPNSFIDYAYGMLYANGYGFFPLVFGLLLLAVFFVLIRRRESAPLLALLVPVLTLLCGVVISLILRPIFVIRYLMASAPLFIFFLAYGIIRFRKDWMVHGAMAVLLVSFLGNLLYLSTGLLPDETRFTKRFQQEAPSVEAYVVQCDTALHTSQVLSYCCPKVPIYSPEVMGDASPYPNIYDVADFQPEECQNYLLFTNVGEAPDAEGFQSEFLYSRHDLYHTVDVWKMTRDVEAE